MILKLMYADSYTHNIRHKKISAHCNICFLKQTSMTNICLNLIQKYFAKKMIVGHNYW